MKLLFLRIFIVTAGALLWAALALATQRGGPDREARIKAEAARPTPRLGDGHPDLSGNWSNPPPPQVPANFVNLPTVKSADGKTLTVLDLDAPPGLRISHGGLPISPRFKLNNAS